MFKTTVVSVEQFIQRSMHHRAVNNLITLLGRKFFDDNKTSKLDKGITEFTRVLIVISRKGYQLPIITIAKDGNC